MTGNNSKYSDTSSWVILSDEGNNYAPIPSNKINKRIISFTSPSSINTNKYTDKSIRKFPEVFSYNLNSMRLELK